jgi:hypothetical protein
VGIFSNLFGKKSNRAEVASTLRKLLHEDQQCNIQTRIELCQKAPSLVRREQDPEVWAGIHKLCGDLAANSDYGLRSANLEQAIEHFEQALTVFTREAFPQEWAGTQLDLAGANWERMRGERADNLERTIHHCKQALSVYTREAFPLDWAKTQLNLASACRERIRGERADNVERTSHHCEQPSRCPMMLHQSEPFNGVSGPSKGLVSTGVPNPANLQAQSPPAFDGGSRASDARLDVKARQDAVDRANVSRGFS